MILESSLLIVNLYIFYLGLKRILKIIIFINIYILNIKEEALKIVKIFLNNLIIVEAAKRLESSYSRLYFYFYYLYSRLTLYKSNYKNNTNLSTYILSSKLLAKV
ncbi:hypothetical protein J3E72DRAFT_271959 [Bipolaris maydis]|nr:hypothetical protein J3E72DRAFT_271959 [Bipolaris maydis]